MQSRGQGPSRGHGIRVHGVPAAAPVERPERGAPDAGDRPERPARPRRDQPPAPPTAEFEAAPSRFERTDAPIDAFAKIKVVGVGGAGGNAINRMVLSGVEGIEFVAVNTDAQALVSNQAPIAVRIGDKLTKGLGAGGRPEVGERAAEESAEDLADLMAGSDMVFITAGMGGGTGTGASPVVARLAKQAGALTVGVVTRPFEFEGGRRRRAAEEGVNALRDVVDALITIPNERLIHMVDPKTPITEAFRIADDVLRQGIAGISDLITKPGVINLDFADVKTIMRDAGSALMAIGHGTGENRCIDAAREAIESPLLEMNIQGATGVLYNITGGNDLTLIETSEAAEIIRAAADEDAEIIYGTSIDESLGDAVMITLIATGFDEREMAPPVRGYGRQVVERAPVYRTQPAAPAPRSAPPRAAQSRPAQQRPPAQAPVMPEDDWDTESSIIRFLRER